MRASPAVAALSLLALMPVNAYAAAPKNVLIVRGESPDLPGITTVIQAIETTVRETVSTSVEFYIESVETGRFDISSYEQRLADLIADKYADIPLDLVVALSQPATQFVLRERPILFPRAPILFGVVERNMLDASSIPPGGSIVFVQIDAPGTVRLAQRAYPAARRVLVTGGTSRFDRGWQRVVRDQLREIESAVPIAYDTDSALDDLARRISTLPPDTIVLYLS